MVLDIEHMFDYNAYGSPPECQLKVSAVETVSIDEDIRVGAAFDGRRVIPVWFRWRNRYYRVKAVNYSWSTDHGAAKLRHYAVSTDGMSLYELQFNSITLEWTLSKVCTE